MARKWWEVGKGQAEYDSAHPEQAAADDRMRHRLVGDLERAGTEGARFGLKLAQKALDVAKRELGEKSKSTVAPTHLDEMKT